MPWASSLPTSMPSLSFGASLRSACGTQPTPSKMVTHFPRLRSFALIGRSEEHTSELQSHSDLHSFPTRRSSDLDEGDRFAARPVSSSVAPGVYELCLGRHPCPLRCRA